MSYDRGEVVGGQPVGVVEVIDDQQLARVDLGRHPADGSSGHAVLPAEPESGATV